MQKLVTWKPHHPVGPIAVTQFTDEESERASAAGPSKQRWLTRAFQPVCPAVGPVLFPQGCPAARTFYNGP